MARLIVAISKVENGTMNILGDPANKTVITNRQLWLQNQGIDINCTTRLMLTYDQDNFCRYRVLTNENKGEGLRTDGFEPSDAIIITEPGHAAFLPIADCVAAVFFDEVHSVFMLSHLGRHSLEQRGGVKSVEYLVEHFGVNPATLKVWLAPAPNKEIYPIFAFDNKGMKEVVYEQLAEAGIVSEHINDNAADTAVDPHYYSHSMYLKGDKAKDGRFAMAAMMVD